MFFGFILLTITTRKKARKKERKKERKKDSMSYFCHTPAILFLQSVFIA